MADNTSQSHFKCISTDQCPIDTCVMFCPSINMMFLHISMGGSSPHQWISCINHLQTFIQRFLQKRKRVSIKISSLNYRRQVCHRWVQEARSVMLDFIIDKAYRQLSLTRHAWVHTRPRTSRAIGKGWQACSRVIPPEPLRSTEPHHIHPNQNFESTVSLNRKENSWFDGIFE